MRADPEKLRELFKRPVALVEDESVERSAAVEFWRSSWFTIFL